MKLLQLVRLLFPLLVLHSTICLPRALVGVLAVAPLSGLCGFAPVVAASCCWSWILVAGSHLLELVLVLLGLS